MNKNIFIKFAASAFIGMMIVPAAIGASVGLIADVANGVVKLVRKAKHKKIKNGSIIEIDGDYYVVHID